MPTPPRFMTREQRDVIVNLHISDQQTGGQPVLQPHEVPIARAWLPEALTDADKLEEHLGLLAELYRCALPLPPSRRERGEDARPVPSGSTAFRYWEPLDESRANAVAEGGPDVLTEAELAGLLLNPFALYDLADRIRTELPRWWIRPLAEAGRDIMDRHDLVFEVPPRRKSRRKRRRQPLLQGPAPVEKKGDELGIGFGECDRAKKQRLAEAMYGDPDADFRLALHWRKAAGVPGYVVELQVSPAPAKNNVTLSILINSHLRTFTVEAPPSVRLDPEADVPASAFGRAGEPVPEEAFPLKGEAEWDDNAWPPHLVLRCRCGMGTRVR